MHVIYIHVTRAFFSPVLIDAKPSFRQVEHKATSCKSAVGDSLILIVRHGGASRPPPQISTR